MKLRSLTLHGWRNLVAETVVPGDRATVLHGGNGQGKTNIIEAIFYLVAFRSFRTSSTADLIGWKSGGLKLEAQIETQGLARSLAVEITPERKRFLLDGKATRRDAHALAQVAVVLFVPEDLLLPRAAPSERRRFLDLAVFGTERRYYREAQVYQRLVRNRNVVLRSGNADRTLLDALDEQIARAGAVVLCRRRDITQALRPRLQRLFQEIHGTLQADMTYQSHAELAELQGEEALTEGLLAGLRARRDLDLRRRFTGFGPHTDDLVLSLGGHPARQHGSQGQLRALVLALKLAELENLTETLSESPVLLLDDVASELDEERRRRLFETISRLPGQTLISVTDPDFLPRLPGRLDLAIRAGKVAPIDPGNATG